LVVLALGGCDAASAADPGADTSVLEAGTDAPRPRVPEDDFTIAVEVPDDRACPAWAAPPRRVTEASEGENDLAPLWTLSAVGRHHVAFADDGSLRLLGSGTLEGVSRAGVRRWSRDVIVSGPTWALAPDGHAFLVESSFEAPSRMVEVDAEGRLVGERSFDAAMEGEPQAVMLALGPEGRVYVSNGRVHVLCRSELREVLTVRDASGDVHGAYVQVVDEDGAALLAVRNSARALRRAQDGTTHEWVGGLDVASELVDTGVFALRGRRVVVVHAEAWDRITDYFGSLETSLVEPDGWSRVVDVSWLDGLGRTVLERDGWWTWERSDGGELTIEAPCAGPLPLHDGGFLCIASDDAMRPLLRVVSPDGEILREHDLGLVPWAYVYSMTLDVDGRIAFITRPSDSPPDTGPAVLHVLASSLRPARRVWHVESGGPSRVIARDAP
jgi:hypothetical protein